MVLKYASLRGIHLDCIQSTKTFRKINSECILKYLKFEYFKNTIFFLDFCQNNLS